MTTMPRRQASQFILPWHESGDLDGEKINDSKRSRSSLKILIIAQAASVCSGHQPMERGDRGFEYRQGVRF
jgi:hypothetical protein